MNFFWRVFSTFKSGGIRGLIFKSWRRLRSPPPRAKCYRICKKILSSRSGLEIGGPSGIFSRGCILPVYTVVDSLDNCNFADKTTWEGSVEEGMTFHFDENRPPGRQYVSEASNLSMIPSGKYDFVLSSHVIEHIANPFKALSEWLRVIKDNGFLVLVAPHKEGTFDHQRPVTTFEHLLKDFECGVGEDDMTHLPEILELHDLKQSPEAGTFEEFKARSERNFENRCLHHHVIDTLLIARILNHLNLQILALEPFMPYDIIAVARKVPSIKVPDNRNFLGRNAVYRLQSPFSSDWGGDILGNNDERK